MPTITEILLDSTLPLESWGFDPSVGSGMTMTAKGWQPTADVEAFVRAEAARLQTQEPREVEFA